jgi:hypothetical protein
VALRLPMVLSFGVAAGLEEHQKASRELMISVKIL